MKYFIPKTDELDYLDFQFEFNTIKETIIYIKKFAKQNKQDLIELFFPGLDPDEYEHRQTYMKCDKDNNVLEIVKTKIRIGAGKIQKQDYMWVVPPWLKDNKSVLMNVHHKRLEKYMIDTRLAFYDQSYLGKSRKKAQKLVLYNELLQLIIKSLPDDPFGIPAMNTVISEPDRIKHNIFLSKDKAISYLQNGNELLAKYCFHNANKLEYELYELLFSNKQTVMDKAKKSLNSILAQNKFNRFPKYTSIQEKENIILQYLKLQTPKVRASNNSRGKGVNANKKQTVILYHSQNPDASISEIARNCNVDRKTVRNYLK